MSSEKRPARSSFSSGALVKRQKSDTNMDTTVAVSGSTAKNGALIQSVRIAFHMPGFSSLC